MISKIESKDSRTNFSLNEDFFKELYENAPLAYQSLDGQGNLIEVNPAWLEIFGYSKKEVIGRWFGDFLAEDQVKIFRERFPKFKESGKAHVEFDMIRKDGKDVMIEFVGKIGFDKHGNFRQTHCILKDVTSERQSEKMIKILTENTEAYLYALDKNGIIKYANKTMHPIERDKIIGTKVTDWVPKIYHEYSLSVIKEVFEKKIIKKFGIMLPDEKGIDHAYHCILTPIINNDIVDECILTAIDITEPKSLRRALDITEEKYKKLFDQMPTGLSIQEMIFDADRKPIDYRFLELNPAFEKLTGIKISEALGKRVKEFIPNLEKYWTDNYGKVVLTGEPMDFEDYLSGLNKYFEVRAFHIEKNIFATIFQDITSRRMIEKDINKKNEELERFNKFYVDREQKMVELKKRIKELEESLGSNQSAVSREDKPGGFFSRQ